MSVTDRALTRGPEVWLIYRQSNALGRKVTPTSPPPSLPRSDIRYLYWDMVFAAPTADRDLDDLTTALWGGSEMTFGVDMVDANGRDVAVAKIARGSTGPVEWDPSDPTKNTSLAIAALRDWIEQMRLRDARDPYVAGAVFIGGEQEALSGALSAAMQANLELQVARWREDFGAIPQWVADMPSTVGGRSDANVALCNAGIAAAVAADPNLYLLSISDLPREGDVVHYTADSQQTIGERFAVAADAVAAFDPADDSDAVRVSMYTVLTTAQYVARHLGYATIRVAPVDALWAVEDPFGAHWVSRTAWAEV